MHCDRLPVASSVTVAFEQSTYNVSEGDGTTQVCVEVSGIPAGGLECEIMVTLTTMDNTAGIGFKGQRIHLHVYSTYTYTYMTKDKVLCG